MENNKRVYYPCFSNNLKDFLASKNYKYLIKCKHSETLVDLWIYLYKDDGLLDKYLEEWKTVRKLRKN